MIFAPSELILNDDGSIYHLHLHPEQIADWIITVGDPDRVGQVSKYFDRIEHQVNKREFVTHTGYLGSRRLTVISTGIGTDNVDIVLNELDALASIDLANRCLKPQPRPLTFVRLGTSGCMRSDIPVGSFLASSFGLGLDGLMQFYPWDSGLEAGRLELALREHLRVCAFDFPFPYYLASANKVLLEGFVGTGLWEQGITLTANGFYGPQQRHLRLKGRYEALFEPLERFEFEGHRITNLEMETSGLYGLAWALGHRAISLNVLLANRRLGLFADNPAKLIEDLIERSLAQICDWPQGAAALA